MKTIKNISLTLLAVVMSSMVVSCDMDKEPYGTLIEDVAVQKMNDVHRFRNIMYTSLRSMTHGSWVIYSDIQVDEFHGIISNGNRLGEISNGIFDSSTEELESFYASCYGRLANANYLIDKIEDLRGDEAFATEVAQIELDRYQAEAYFTRAFIYFFLVDHYCQPYSEEIAETPHLGAQIVTKYNPSGDLSSYPDRSTLKDTYDLIESDLKKAYDGLKAFEAKDNSQVKPMANYLSSYTVEAMQARVALVKGDYDTAYEKSTDVINSGIYTLSTVDNFANMWTNDTNDEIIFQPFESVDELGSSIGSIILNVSGNNINADYIPLSYIYDLYEDDDVRFDTYFTIWKLNIEGSDYPSYVFNKYPGNPALRTGEQNNFANKMKPFRLAEQYLIAAESAVFKSTQDLSKASEYLTTLLDNRVDGGSILTGNYTNQSAIFNAIKIERLKELIGEGFRFSDLRRWKQGFTRDASRPEYSPLEDVIVGAGASLSYTDDDYRFTWPIPKTEFDSNPNMKGQQNPGY